MRQPVLAISMAVAAATVPCSARALDAREVFKAADPSIVVVLAATKAGDNLGSGVLVDTLDAVTSCHVVDEATKITVVQGYVQRSARVRFQDGARDLCQLRLDDALPEGRPATLLGSWKELEPGQQVFAVGAPRGLERTITVGIVSALREMQAGAAPLIQTDAAVSSGSSGGGLFDQNAKLVGIITFGFKDGQNLNFAIPADWIRELPERNRDRLSDAPPAAGGAGAEGATSAPTANQTGFVRPGDRWTYRLALQQRTIGKVTITADSVDSGHVNERVSMDISKSFSAERRVDTAFRVERFQPSLVLAGGYQMAELAPYFPPETALKAGQTWKGVPGEFVVYPVGRQSLSSDVRVVGREKVRVPAGQYDAWRVETVSTPVTYNGNQIRIKCTYWYSPGISRAVKIVVFSESGYAVVQSTETYELSAFTRGDGH
jgi:hypothetical protein